MTSPGESALARELDVATELAREAGRIALSYRHENLAVELKPGNEPVTVADHEASRVVVEGLSRAFPDDVVISEETPDDPARLAAHRTWYVDPIDGTKEFIRGGVGFCVMVGLCIDHRPAVGVIVQPTTRSIFVAAPDVGGYLLRPGAAPEPLRCSRISDPGALRLVASKSNRTDAIDRLKEALGISDEQNIGSVGLKLAVIALGERDLYVNLSPRTSSWDTCAPEAILVAAGGQLTDLDGAALRYDDPDLSHRRGLVASNGVLHQHIIAKLAPLHGAG